MAQLSNVQREMFEYIKSNYEQRGFPPTIREIGKRFGITSTNGVRHHLAVLTNAGLIEREAGKFRGIRMVTESMRDFRSVGSLPVMGQVAAGLPSLAAEDIECEVKIDKTLFGVGSGEEVFGLRIHGDSMRDAGILDGDIAVIRKQETAQDGDIVVALVEDEATVKRYRHGNGTVLLEPENPEYQPIIVTHDDGRFAIIGKVVGVLGQRF